jgi:modulator of FtsH protease HflK
VAPPTAGPLLDSVRTALRLLRGIGGLLALAILGSGVTVVRPDEVALVLRFGQLTGRTRVDQVRGPGLVLAFPYLVDEVVRVPVKRVQETRIDTLTNAVGASGDRLDVTRDGYALTGDHNIVQPEAVLKYQVTDPVTWALRVTTPDAMIRDAVVAALTRTLGEMAIDPVLGDGRKALAARALERAQARLDADGPWVRLVALEFTAIRPPAPVAQAFDEVQSAFVERKTRVDAARSFREQALPRAAATAEAEVRDAEAAEAALLATARGAAAAFLAIQAEYRKSPAVVRQRLYRETMEVVFSAVGGRVLVPAGAGTGRLLIPGESGSGPGTAPEGP